jgi:hypothetical protein
MALLWPTHPIALPPQPQAQPSNIAQRMVANPVTQAAPLVSQPVAAAPANSGTLGLANMTALYTDKLTGGRQ